MARARIADQTPVASGRRMMVADCFCTRVRPGGCNIIEEMQTVGTKTEANMARGGTSCAGKSIREFIEDELDACVDRLKAGQSADREGMSPEEGIAYDKGEAYGLAFALAYLRNPYWPNVPEIRNEAMLRYDARIEEPASNSILSILERVGEGTPVDED